MDTNKFRYASICRIEATTMRKFVAAAAKGHKRKKYILGDIKSAVAKTMPSTHIYEVVYIDVKDPANSTKTKQKRITLNIN